MAEVRGWVGSLTLRLKTPDSAVAGTWKRTGLDL